MTLVLRANPFEVAPAPRPRPRHLRNAHKLRALRANANSSCWWWDAAEEIGLQLRAESFVAIDDFCGPSCFELRAEAESALARAEQGRVAGSGDGSAAQRLRGDRTVWASQAAPGSVPSLPPLVSRLSGLAGRLAALLPDELADVQLRSDAQLAFYPATGARYVRHVDNTCSSGRGRLCNGRRLTAVYYLNREWRESDGGELRILGRDGESGREAPLLDVAPKLDRLLVFFSDGRVPHEVLPSFAPRYAATVWLLSASELQAAAPDRRESQGVLPMGAEGTASSAVCAGSSTTQGGPAEAGAKPCGMQGVSELERGAEGWPNCPEAAPSPTEPR